MQVEQLTAADQASCRTPGAIPSARCNIFPVRSHKNMSHIKLDLIKTGVYFFLKMAKQTKGKIIADIIGKDKSTQLL